MVPSFDQDFLVDAVACKMALVAEIARVAGCNVRVHFAHELELGKVVSVQVCLGLWLVDL